MLKVNNEASLIRDEMKNMTTVQIAEEYKRLREINPTSQRTVLFSMELQTRQLFETVKPEKAKLR